MYSFFAKFWCDLKLFNGNTNSLSGGSQGAVEWSLGGSMGSYGGLQFHVRGLAGSQPVFQWSIDGSIGCYNVLQCHMKGYVTDFQDAVHCSSGSYGVL